MPRKSKSEAAEDQQPQFQIVEREGRKWVSFPGADKEENKLASHVTYAISYFGDSDDAELVDEAIRLDTIAANIENLKNYLKRHTRGGLNEAKPLITAIEAEMESLRTFARDRVRNGEAMFFDINLIFSEGTEVYYGSGMDMQGGVVGEVRLRKSFMGPYWAIEVKSISNRSGKVGSFAQTLTIGAFEGLIDIAKFPVKLMTAPVKAQLAERGRNYLRYVDGAQHLAYTGAMTAGSGWSEREYRATGRVMIDIEALRQVEPNYFNRISYGASDDDDEQEERVEGAALIAEADLWRTSPYLYGFSFVAKAWGRFNVAALNPIQWRDDAFDKLVLPNEEKEMIRALVEHNSGSFTDIVDGKGGGCIFLLHGPPGQGKTLTAETVSELLHKPLYMISVGELGTNPDELEERLRTILDIATLWDAVLLLDEADIFLEARDESNIVRNAMVGVFLRLLEYHQGVLFLTSNRAKNIDAAFYSRISVALRFAESTHAKREQIWSNLLESAGIDGLTVSKLAEHEINGRQIKTSIRLAQTLAKSRGEIITQQLVERTIKLGARFDKD